MKKLYFFILSIIVLHNISFSQCTPAIIRGSANINTPPFAVGTRFNTSTTSPVLLSGLGNDIIKFYATVGGSATWTTTATGGIQIKNDMTVGDYIFVQPNNTDNAATSNIATYSFKYSEPVQNLSLRTGGMNNQDQVIVTAYLGGTPITINASNFPVDSIVDDPGNGGTISISVNSLVGNNTSGGTAVITNRFSTLIPGPVDSVVFKSGKADDGNGTVTLGFTTVGYTRCVTAPPDVNATFVGVNVTGNVGTNDVKPNSTTYGTATVVSGNPGPAIPTINADGTYSFTSAIPGVFQFLVPMCPPSVLSADCPNVLLTITVNDPNTLTNIPVANIDRVTTPINTPVTLNTLANDQSGNKNIPLNPASVMVTIPPLHGTTMVNPVTGEITFTPTLGYTGYDTLTYQVCDAASPTPHCTISKQIITIEPVGAANSTVATDDYNSGPLNTILNGNVKLNDSDPQGNTQTITAQPSTFIPGKGTLILNTDGTYSFTPVSGYFGPVNFPYQTCDNGTPQACTNATLYILVRPSNTLPLDLISFKAIKNNGNTLLTWITENQINVDHFIIERSKNNASSFEEIGMIPANSSSSGVYNFTDVDASRTFTKGYYRLKSVDIDNRFSYSKILLLSFRKSLVIDIRPSIVRLGEIITLSVSGDDQKIYNGMLYNISGQVEKSFKILTNQNLQIETSNLIKGMYFLKILGEDAESIERIIIQ